jgi:DNA-3-methyladenine glycosylase II
MEAFSGLRPVGFTSPYECACWGVISQRITKEQASRIVAELVRAHGEVVRLAGEAIAVFPRPDRLLDVRTAPGLAAVKVERLHAIATAGLEGRLDAAELGGLDEAEACARLRALPGIGPFWASAIYLRACGIADVFPDEPISLAALGNLHDLGDHPPAAKIAELVELYRPFRMWVAFLLRVAAARGMLGGIGGREGAIRRRTRSALPAELRSRGARGPGVRG